MTCKYKECKRLATKRYAMVPLCQQHHELIEDETMRYYTKFDKTWAKISYVERVHYHEISHLIPWRQKHD